LHNSNVKTLIVAGSGGHTSEILRLLAAVGKNYYSRHYVVARTDKRSEEKIEKAERKYGSSQYYIHTIPRSREVKQSYFTSFFTTIYASVYCFPLVFWIRPDLVLCNGPGTCIPVCLAAFMLKWLGIQGTTTMYVESICRVDSLSLSGTILYCFADHVLVQWPELKQKYPSSTYLGRVV